MTDNQFDLFILHGGMMQEGMSSEQALAAIIAMDEPAEDIQWLVERLRRKGKKLNITTQEDFKVGTIWKGKRKHRFVQS
jgi:hypothetical protein